MKYSKRTACHTWIRNETKIPGDGWVASMPWCRNMLQMCCVLTMRCSCRAVSNLKPQNVFLYPRKRQHHKTSRSITLLNTDHLWHRLYNISEVNCQPATTCLPDVWHRDNTAEFWIVTYWTKLLVCETLYRVLNWQKSLSLGRICSVWPYMVVFLFNTVIYVFLLLGLYILIVWLPWLRFFLAFSSVVRQIPGYNSPSRGTARTLPKLLCCSTYCLFCVVLWIVCV